MRRTVPPLTTLPGWSDEIPLSAATVPLSTLVTKRYAVFPKLVDVMSHGPLIAPPAHVSTSWPVESRTRRQPAPMPWGVPSLSVPFAVVGRLPTTTQPPGRIDSAVVKPIPPGHAPGSEADVMSANTDWVPVREIWTIVVPVPWAFETSLKLLTSVLPST